VLGDINAHQRLNNVSIKVPKTLPEKKCQTYESTVGGKLTLQTVYNPYLFIFTISDPDYYKKKRHKPPSKKKKRGKNLSPRNRKACHSVSTALLKSVADIGSQSAMKSSRKTLHEFTSHIPQKITHKGNRSTLFP
jgi:predicted transcriptional regulator